ncbi:hypothetical protein CHUAL_012073 [Chamberlinius hualienensis]
MSQEFLPLCDVLFNIISLVSYFCDVVFDLLVIYTLYMNENVLWFSISLTFVLISLISCQIMSFKWHLRSPMTSTASTSRSESLGKSWKISLKRNWEFSAVITVHLLQCGVLWRYFKLFIPVDLRYVKKCLRDLCLLRLTHAFCQAMPLLLIQLHFIWKTSSTKDLEQLNLVSTSLSLVNVCWALASFNKHIRLQNLHKLVLTWLGVIYQFMWRLGTVSSRVTALSLYATVYNFWLFLVIALHWISMFLWLISPKNVFHGETVSRKKKLLFSLLISYVYIFCYVNLLEVNSRRKMLAYYVVMFLENSLLMTVWLIQQQNGSWFKYLCVALVWGGFAFGILFMILYYRYFHVKRLKHGRMDGDGAEIPTFGESAVLPVDSNTNFVHHNRKNQPNNTVNQLQLSPNANYVPGVFNCRLNPAFKRKKKKPTTFIPLPVVQHHHLPHHNVKCNNNNNRNVLLGKSELPFWKRPLPKSDRGSSNSLIDIRLKLQEKRKQQLQELRVIEEEIKQGKLQRPNPINEVIEHGTIRQPIPQAKKQPYDISNRPYLPSEVILAPKYLNFGHFNELQPHHSHLHAPNCDLSMQNNDIYKSYRCMASDLDSQLSLPRSFTLPREFRYQRKTKQRKNNVRSSEHHHRTITSTNSSDGDVDSDDGHHYVNKLTNNNPNSNRNCCNNSNSSVNSNNKHHETQL